MALLHFKNSKFIKTAILPKDYPQLRNLRGQLMPEIAVAGRSNVGKSTLLNHLFNVQKLVKTSSTPGKTQAVNFFTVNDEVAFADLPGYGYAKVPESVRKQWGPMVQSYLEKRETLKLILFIFDIRREPNDEDRQFMEWIMYHQKAWILVLNKVDKVSQSECLNNTKTILSAFDCDQLHYLHYSATKNIGRDRLIKMLQGALNDKSHSTR